MNSTLNRMWIFSVPRLKLFNKKFTYLALMALYCSVAQATNNDTATADTVSAAASVPTTNSGNNSMDYPDLWFKKEEKGMGEFVYPPAGDKRFELPNGLPDVARLKWNGPILKPGEPITYSLETFFGSKTFKLKSFDQRKYIATLMSGEQLQFEGGNQPHSEYYHAPSDVTYTEANGQTKVIRVNIWLPDGSAIGTESLLLDRHYPCEPIFTALVRLDPTRKPVWRWAMAALGPIELLNERKEDPCFFVPQQRLISDASPFSSVLMPDGTVLVDMHFMFVRIDANTGLAKHLPATVRIVNVDDLMKFTIALHNRLDEENFAQDYHGPKPMPYIVIPYYLILQYFLFPNLLVSL
jgi:hypothetical protein